MKKNYNSRTEKDYNFWRALYYQLFVVFVVWPVSKLMYNIKVEGRENVPKSSRVIYAGNHVSYLDPPMMPQQRLWALSSASKSGSFQISQYSMSIRKPSAHPSV